MRLTAAAARFPRAQRKKKIEPALHTGRNSVSAKTPSLCNRAGRARRYSCCLPIPTEEQSMNEEESYCDHCEN